MLYAELIEYSELPHRPSQELVLGVLNKKIVGGSFKYQIAMDTKELNTVALDMGKHTLRK